MIQFLTTDLLNTFDTNDNTTMNLSFYNTEIIRQKGKYKSGYNDLPNLQQNTQVDPLYSDRTDFLITNNTINIIPSVQTTAIKKITIEKKALMDIFIGYHQQLYDLNLSRVLGRDQIIQVAIANGSAESIVDWGTTCGLDTDQQIAFQIITGYYVLSYIYDLKNMDEEDQATTFIKEEQRRLEHLVGHSGIKSNQLICFLHGPGGSGKSTVISLLQQYSREYHMLLKNNTYNRSIVITAMTGVAATIIGGETAHSAMCLNYKKIPADQIELWPNTKLVVVDEISFANNDNIDNINQKLSILKENSRDPFGGIHIIFCGDLRQLEPINGKPLYRDHVTESSLFKLHMNCYIELNGQHRFNQDPEWGRLLSRFREGLPTESDISTINQRYIKQKKISIPADIKYATYRNSDRDAINTGIFVTKIKHSADIYFNTDNFIMIFADKIRIQKDSSFIQLSQHRRQFFYENCGESNIKNGRSGRIDPVLKIYKNCEVMLTENIDVFNGLANGTRATVQTVSLHTGHNFFQVNVGNLLVKGIYASSIEHIMLKHINSGNQTTQTFKVQPKQRTFRVAIPVPLEFATLYNNQKKNEVFTMRANQIPIIVNNATTGHKLQGTGVDNLFVHAWSYKRNWPYVILSRVRQRNGLFLRHKIDKNISKYAMDDDLISFIAYFKNLLPQQNPLDTNT